MHITETLKSILAELIQLNEIPQNITEDPKEGSLADLTSRLAYLQNIVAVTKNIIENITETLAGQMITDEQNVAGFGYLIRKPKFSSTWIDDSSREKMFEDALDMIVRRVATDQSTGEIHRNLANAVRESWRLAHESFSFGADPKVAFRKVLNLDPGDYRSKRRVGYTISVGEPRI